MNLTKSAIQKATYFEFFDISYKDATKKATPWGGFVVSLN